MSTWIRGKSFWLSRIRLGSCPVWAHPHSGRNEVGSRGRGEGDSVLTSRIFPNSIARSRTDKDRRVYVSDEIEQCRDLSDIVYRRPFDKGMLVSWDAEKVIWDRVFGKEGLDVSPFGL